MGGLISTRRSAFSLPPLPALLRHDTTYSWLGRLRRHNHHPPTTTRLHVTFLHKALPHHATHPDDDYDGHDDKHDADDYHHVADNPHDGDNTYDDDDHDDDDNDDDDHDDDDHDAVSYTHLTLPTILLV